MKTGPIGISQRKTDTVALAMDILKDRELPKGTSRQEARRNLRPPSAKKPEER